MINARSETVPEKPSFRRAFKERRCLVLVDGFYEWKRTDDNGKQPYHIRMKDRRPFAFGGLWESWRGGREEIRSCTILTTEANYLVREIHNRMPMILAQDHELWLDPDVWEADPLLPLLTPYPGDIIEAYPVSRFVNRPTNDDPRCIQPLSGR